MMNNTRVPEHPRFTRMPETRMKGRMPGFMSPPRGLVNNHLVDLHPSGSSSFELRGRMNNSPRK